MPDLVGGAPVRVVASVVASSGLASAFQFTLNGAALGSILLDPRPNCDFCAIATTGNSTLQAAPANPGTELKVGLTYASPDAAASGYLDYLEINAERQLRLSGAQLEFRSLANIGPGNRNRYVLAGAPATGRCGT